MFINKASDGANNRIGEKLTKKRKEIMLSQKKFADRLQLLGLDVDKNAIQRIECGKRFVTSIFARPSGPHRMNCYPGIAANRSSAPEWNQTKKRRRLLVFFLRLLG